MSISSRSSNKGGPESLPAERNDIDRLFGSEFGSNGWVVDLTSLRAASSGDEDPLRWADEDLDPAMIWAMGGRRR